MRLMISYTVARFISEKIWSCLLIVSEQITLLFYTTPVATIDNIY